LGLDRKLFAEQKSTPIKLRAPTDYESKEYVCDEPKSQVGQGSLIVHTVRECADLRRFRQNIPQQEILIQFRVD